MSRRFRSAKMPFTRWRDPEISEGSLQVGKEAHIHNNGDPSVYNDLSAEPKTEVDSGDSEVAETTALTVQDFVDSLGFGIFQVKFSILNGLPWMADAMELALMSILGSELRCEWRLSAIQVALISVVVMVGMALGSPLWGATCDKYGRKTGLVMSTAWTFFYGLLSAFSPGYSLILVLRGLAGIGIAGGAQSVTLYSEFLPTKSRATYIMLMQVFWAFGGLFEVVLAMLVLPRIGWRWLLGLSNLPFLLYLVFCAWVPESPRFDLHTGNRTRAMATLKRVADGNGRPMPRGVLVSTNQTERRGLRDLFARAHLRTTLLLLLVWFGFAFTYYGIVLLTTEVLQGGSQCQASAVADQSCSLGCRRMSQADFLGLLWTSLAELPGIAVALLVVDRIGRKKTMAMTFVVYSLAVLPLFACIGRTAHTVFIFVARAFITGGFQVAYIYTPEVYPTETRALAMGTCATAAKLGALVAPFVSQVTIGVSLSLPVGIFCGCSLLAAVATICMPIETANRALLESHPHSAEHELGPSMDPPAEAAAQANATAQEMPQLRKH